MPTVIDQPVVILSEGMADKNFIEKFVVRRMGENRCCFPFPNNAYYSSSMFNKMLSAIKGDGFGYSQLKGVIIIADSCDSPQNTFDDIVNKMREVVGFALPQSLGVVEKLQGVPSTCIQMLPANNKIGGLETLFNEDMAIRHKRIYDDANSFLSSAWIDQERWNAEKVGKAHYATLVAATHRDDPSRAAAHALRDPPTVNLASNAFDHIESNLRRTIDDILR